jgi:hypothetical protein
MSDSGRHYLTADTVAEGEQWADALGLPGDALRLAGTPRWHYRLDDGQWLLALGCLPGNPIRQVGATTFRHLVATRTTPAPAADAGVVVCGPAGAVARRPPRFNPTLARHWWRKTQVHWRTCQWCALVEETVPVGGNRYQHVWTRPDLGSVGDADGGRMPRCTGPHDRDDTGAGVTTTQPC